MRILGIAGSLRRGSHNRKLLRAAAELLPPGVELVEWDGLGTLPIFDEDLELTPPPPVRAFFDEIEASDAILIATPEYNSSLPGGLKNAIDWASRPFPENVLKAKPTAVVGASTTSTMSKIEPTRRWSAASCRRRSGSSRFRAAGTMWSAKRPAAARFRSSTRRPAARCRRSRSPASEVRFGIG